MEDTSEQLRASGRDKKPEPSAVDGRDNDTVECTVTADKANAV